MINYGKPNYLPVRNLHPVDYYRDLEEASYALGMLQVAHGKIANSEHLIKPLLTREASLSSKIEGTITNSKDVFILDASGKAPKQDTVVVANYRSAMRLASKLKDQNTLTQLNLRELHAVLLRNTPYKGTLGRYRQTDAWIGKNQNTSIEKALYVAPPHVQVPSYMENLLSYINDVDESPLIKTAIFHYQFEAIHPFEDGNGRIGRMMVPALLHYFGSLSAPVLYTSEYFEKMSSEYRIKLHEVDTGKNLTPWVKFFLHSLKEQCAISIGLVDKIIELHATISNKYRSSHSPNMSRVIDYIFEHPAFSRPEIIAALGINRLTATSLMSQLENDKTIELFPEVKGPYNTGIYVFPQLLGLIN